MDTVTYDIWLDTGDSYKLIGLRFTERQVDEYVSNLSRDMIEYRVISEEHYGKYPVFTRATKWNTRK